MTSPSSPAGLEFSLKLQKIITSLQAIEASFAEGTGSNGADSFSPETRISLEDARQKLGEIAGEIERELIVHGQSHADGKPDDQAALELELARWASYPELSINPILDINLQGQVLYTNPTARKLFPDLQGLGLRHPYLAGWGEVVQALSRGPASDITREVPVGEKLFQQSVFYIKEFDCLRVYGLDVTERFQIEEELRISNEELEEQRAFLKAILQQLPIAVGIFDAQTGGQILGNPALDRLWRNPPETVDTSADFRKYACFHMDDSPYAYEDLPLVRTLKTGQPVQDEVMKIRRGDATEGIIGVNTAPIYLNGALIAGVNVITDITGRVQTARALRESEGRYRALVETSPDAIIVQRDGRFIFTNQAALNMYGAESFEQLSAYTVLDLVPPSELDKTRERIERAAAGARVSVREASILRLDGQVIDIEIAGVPIDYQGAKAVLAVGHDITRRKRAERQLQESEEKYRRIIEMTNEGIWMVDRETRTTFVNRQMAEMLGYAPEEMLGKKSIEFMDEESQARVPELLKRREQGIAEVFEYKFVRKDGSILWCISNAVPILDKDGQFGGSLGMLTDISGRKKREAELKALNRTLQAISGSNQAMMRATSEESFMNEVCQIIVEDCGHAMVWIGLAEQDEYRSVRPVANAGFEQGYLETLKITWADTERGRGPTGTAIRTGKMAMCRDMLTDPKFEPWRAEAIKRGYASSIVLPLLDEVSAFGALTIYSRQPDPFSADEIKLLSELAGDLSFGIKTLRQRKAQKEAEAALKASEEKYRSLFNGMTEGFALNEIVCDESGAPCDYRFMEINPAFEHLTGLQKEDVVGKLYSQVFPDDGPYWVKIFGDVALSGEPVHSERYSPTLKQHYEVFAYRPAPGQFAVLFLNITKRKEMENALQKAHDELEQRVVERTRELEIINEELRVEIDEHKRAEGVISRNAALTGMLAEVSRRLSVSNLEVKAILDTVTPAAGKTIGETCLAWLLSEDGSQLILESLYPSDQTVGDNLRKAFEPGLTTDEGTIGQVIKSGRPLFAPHLDQAQTRMLIKSGYQTLVGPSEVNSLMIAPLSVAGKTAGALVMTRHQPGYPFGEDDFACFQSLADRAGLAITNTGLYQNLEKTLEQEQTLRRQLIQAEKNLALNRMVSSVAHEINNPIQTIVNCLYLLGTSLPPAGFERDALEMATSETRRIAGLVQQLRDLYRPGQDKSMRPLDVKEILSEVHKLLLPHLQHHQVAWEAPEIPAGLVFNGIPDHIKQVFLNICLNAVDAMDPKGGKISIQATVDTQSRQVGIALTDTGPGIPPEYLDSIFEPFFTTKASGTGLGLAITFDIVRSHGGRITVESQPGAGATFTVWLPVE